MSGAAGRFGAYTGKLYKSGGSVNLTQLQSCAYIPGQTLSTIIPTGAVDPASHVMAYAGPMFRLSTVDLATMFAEFGLATGLCVEDAGTNLSMFGLQQRADCGTFMATAVHTLFEFRKAFLYPRSLQVDQQSQDGATMELEMPVHVDAAYSEAGPIYPFKYTPVRKKSNQALTSLPSPAYVSQYWLGPLYVNSVQVPTLTSLRIDTGISYSAAGWDGLTCPEKGCIVARTPRVSFTVLDHDQLLASRMLAEELGSGVGSIVFVLRKGTTGSDGRVADATGSHISITIDKSTLSADDVTMSGTDDGALNVTLNVKGTLAVATNATIPP